MDCKDCRTGMRKQKLEGVLIDRCPNCEGVWLDGGELEQLARGEGLEDQAMIAQAQREVARERGQISSGGVCPRCAAGPLTRHMAHGVALDRCKGCKGLWFDHGELARVRDATASASASLWGSLKRLLGS